MENKYHNVIDSIELFDSIFAIDGLGPLDSEHLSVIPLDVPLDKNINWAIYLDSDNAYSKIEKQYIGIWLHNYFIAHIVKDTTHNKKKCERCNHYYNKFINALQESITNHTTSYALEYLAKWMIFINFHNDDLMKFVEENSHSTELLFMAYYILYWGERYEEWPNLYKILNKYCSTVKELICKNNLVNDYIDFSISGNKGDGELNNLREEFTQEFYKDLPRDYQLGVIL